VRTLRGYLDHPARSLPHYRIGGRLLARIIQCATKARRTSGWKFHPSNRRFDSVATCTMARATSLSKLQGQGLHLGD
jgi:hypothetical protein